jgi:hypothetical protein
MMAQAFFYLLKSPKEPPEGFITGVCKPVLAVLVPLGNTSGDLWIPAVRPGESGRPDSVFE